MLDELVDAGDQLAHVAEAAAANNLLGDESEPALDLSEIDPAKPSGRI